MKNICITKGNGDIHGLTKPRKKMSEPTEAEVKEWWDENRESSMITGAWVGMKWSELFFEVRSEITTLYQAAIDNHKKYDQTGKDH